MDCPRIAVYNPLDLTRVGFVGHMESFLWIRRYFDSGEFEIIAPLTENNRKCFSLHNLVKPSHDGEVGVVNSISIQENQDELPMITASGLFYAGHLGIRAALERDGTLAGLIRLNCASPSIPERKFPGLVLGNVAELSFDSADTVGRPVTGILKTLALANGFGWRVVMDEARRILTFETYNGLDRRESQTENPRAVFSQKRKNFGQCSYVENDTDAVNVVLGVYENGGLFTTVGEAPDPLSRYEGYVSVSHSTGQAVLKQKCEDKLRETALSLTGTVTRTAGYRKKWNVGDLVTVRHEDWRVSMEQRIYAVQETWDGSGYILDVTFGSPQKEITDFLKK